MISKDFILNLSLENTKLVPVQLNFSRVQSMTRQRILQITETLLAYCSREFWLNKSLWISISTNCPYHIKHSQNVIFKIDRFMIMNHGVIQHHQRLDVELLPCIVGFFSIRCWCSFGYHFRNITGDVAAQSLIRHLRLTFVDEMRMFLAWQREMICRWLYEVVRVVWPNITCLGEDSTII